jgi:hypothetical protein
LDDIEKCACPVGCIKSETQRYQVAKTSAGKEEK